MASIADLTKIWQWNGTKPAAVNRCLHELFTEQAVRRPNALALDAWDGKMEYNKLDAMSSRLAGHLISLGILPDDMVLLCFEKSMWTQVAMLAVLKAGGAFVPLDINQTPSRCEEITRKTGAKVVLASTQYSTLWKDSVQKVVVVNQNSLNELLEHPVKNNVTPENAAYIMFTSGSTGAPKAVVMDHSAISTACPAHIEALSLNHESRVLQFSPYTFDVCIMEIFATLLSGGCVCVPSESDSRDDLAGTINNLSINWLWLTPTVAKLLVPSKVPTLRVLLLGGEGITLHDCDRWKSQHEGEIQLISTYGPTECCITSISSPISYSKKEEFESGFVGKGLASTIWVADLEDPSQLAPIGSRGEIFIEGPLLARGYLHDLEKTSASFIHDPDWLLQGGGGYPGRRGRVYKTGDIARYLPDGSLVYESRTERKAKMTSQQVQRRDIEDHLRECMPQALNVAVEVFVSAKEHKQGKEIVVAFVQLNADARRALLAEPVPGNDLVTETIYPSEVKEKLFIRLPRNLVPAVFFAFPQLPISTSGKLDRKRLRRFVTTLPHEEWSKLQFSNLELED